MLDVLSPEEAAIRDRALVDFKFFCNRFLKIKSKIFKKYREKTEEALDKFVTPDKLPNLTFDPIVPFHWNIAQEVLVSTMMKQLSFLNGVDLVVLKPRQIGLSTISVAWAFWHMWRRHHINATIAVQAEDTLISLVEMINTFYESFPEGYRPELRSKKTRARINKDEVYFQDRKSSLLPVIASRNAKRGSNLDIIICSEVAIYKEPDEFFGSMLPALNRQNPYNTLLLESTARDGFFRKKYLDAKKIGKEIFFPYYINGDLYREELFSSFNGKTKIWKDRYGNRVKFTQEEKRVKSQIDKDILKFNARYGVKVPAMTWEQMYWRQMCIELECNGDEEWFNQEYPHDDISAFAHRSRSMFSIVMPRIQEDVEEVNEPEKGRLVSDTYKHWNAKQEVEFVEDKYVDFERIAGMHIWEHPIENYTYVAGIDVADVHGIQDDDDDDDHAWSVISVYCCDTRRQVAEWIGTIEPNDLGDEAVKIGYYYNGAMLNVDATGIGRSTKDAIERHLNYDNVYPWPDPEVYGKYTHYTMSTFNAKTKATILNSFYRAVRDGDYKVSSPLLMEEMQNFVIKNGKATGDNCTSDCIIAAALSWACVLETEFGYSDLVLHAATEENEQIEDKARNRKLSTAEPPGKNMPIAFRGPGSEDWQSSEDEYSDYFTNEFSGIII